ncbi:MAG: DUF423 domain-containing protein [Afipia sp.]|jgi:hypothetical protein|nr:DUF423 domain-containing protein [Afipia sp.]
MTSNGFVRIATAIAGLMGAAGVVLASLAAHAGDTGRLGPSSTMLLFHAPAAIAAALVTAHGLVQRPLGITATFGLIVGAVLFAGDLTFRHYTGNALFPMAAPTGGTLLILSWLVLATAAAWPRRAG